MGSTVLVSCDVVAGRKLVEALEAAGYEVPDAFWHRSERSNGWDLRVATPAVGGRNWKKDEARIDELLREFEPEFPLVTPQIVGPDDGVVRFLRSEYRGQTVGPGTQYLGFCEIPISEAYIYRLDPPPRRPRKKRRHASKRASKRVRGVTATKKRPSTRVKPRSAPARGSRSGSRARRP
jgi:hypothetical protein